MESSQDPWSHGKSTALRVNVEIKKAKTKFAILFFSGTTQVGGEKALGTRLAFRGPTIPSDSRPGFNALRGEHARRLACSPRSASLL